MSNKPGRFCLRRLGRRTRQKLITEDLKRARQQRHKTLLQAKAQPGCTHEDNDQASMERKAS